MKKENDSYNFSKQMHILATRLPWAIVSIILLTVIVTIFQLIFAN